MILQAVSLVAALAMVQACDKKSMSVSRPKLKDIDTDGLKNTPVVEVVGVHKAVKAGTVLERWMLATTNVAASVVTTNHVVSASAADLLGRRLTRDLAAGQLILYSMLATKDDVQDR